MIIRILIILISLFLSLGFVSASSVDPNIRDISITETSNSNTILTQFTSPIQSLFFVPGTGGKDGMITIFTTIAFQIKNFFIGIAVLFLIIGVIKLLFSTNDEESVKKWKSNIIWVSVGIFVMQISFSVWKTLILTGDSDQIGAGLGWDFWVKIFLPVVGILQMLAALGFLFISVFAFFIMVTAGGDEEKSKKAKNTILYAIIGFLLIRIPQAIIESIYGDYSGCDGDLAQSGCVDGITPEIDKSIGIVGKLFVFFNGFLTVICVLLVIYAGWLVLSSGGDEEKLKKAKHTVLYIIIGFIVLVGSTAIFKFFIMK